MTLHTTSNESSAFLAIARSTLLMKSPLFLQFMKEFRERYDMFFSQQFAHHECPISVQFVTLYLFLKVHVYPSKINGNLVNLLFPVKKQELEKNYFVWYKLGGGRKAEIVRD